MSGAIPEVPIGLKEEMFQSGTHITLVYTDEKEVEGVLRRFLRAGIETGEKVYYLTDTRSPDEIREWLRGEGVDLPDEDDGRLVLMPARDTYCPKGEFCVEDRLEFLKRSYETAMAEGYTGVRIAGECTWAGGDTPGAERFIEYEARANHVFAVHPMSALCMYNAELVDGALIHDVLKVHPMVVSHGQIVCNPCYLEPDEFLGELRERQ